MDNTKRICKYCVWCKSSYLNERSNKVIHYCELQPSKHSNCGYRHIKINTQACCFYKGRR